jgi:site-specific DNA recombinase
LIVSGEVATVAALADRVGVSRSYFARVFRLSFMAPHITRAILEGCQPPELTANKLMLAGRLAPAWPAQSRQLGLE